MKLSKMFRLMKSVNEFTKEVEKLTQQETEQLRKYGIKVEGLFQLLEPETVETAMLYAKYYVKRYEDEARELKETDPDKFNYLVKIGRLNPDGTLSEKRRQDQLRMGLTHKAFEIALQQLQVPYVPNDPTIDWRPKEYMGKDPTDHTTKFAYDFYIPFYGEIDIKSATLENPYANINIREFERENPDAIVCYQILDILKPRWLKLCGFMPNLEVRQYPPQGVGHRAYYQIPVTDFETHNGVELAQELIKSKALVKAYIDLHESKSK